MEMEMNHWECELKETFPLIFSCDILQEKYEKVMMSLLAVDSATIKGFDIGC